MNNKGFTFIELLAILVLLAVVLVITVPSVGDLISNYRENGKVEMLKKSAISAAKEYVVDGNFSTVVCGTNPIDVSDIINKKYLDNDEYYDDKTITVTYDCDSKKFINYEFVE